MNTHTTISLAPSFVAVAREAGAVRAVIQPYVFPLDEQAYGLFFDSADRIVMAVPIISSELPAPRGSTVDCLTLIDAAEAAGITVTPSVLPDRPASDAAVTGGALTWAPF